VGDGLSGAHHIQYVTINLPGKSKLLVDLIAADIRDLKKAMRICGVWRALRVRPSMAWLKVR
jgi:hypothetical protein